MSVEKEIDSLLDETIALAKKEAEGFDFGRAIAYLKRGMKVARKGWNGKGMWLKLIPMLDWTLTESHLSDVKGLVGLPWIGMKTADGGFVPWLASQTDVLAEDWQVVK